MKVGKENQGKARREVKRQSIRTFLVVQQLRLLPSIAGDADSNHGQEAKIPHALQTKSQNIKQVIL